MKNHDDIMWENCEIIIIFPIFGQFGTIRKPEEWFPEECFVKVLFSLIVFFYLTKTESRTRKSLTL